MDKEERAEDLKFTVKLDKKYPVDLSTDLDINQGDINQELTDQPALFAWHGVLAELAKHSATQAKNAMEVHGALLDKMIREQAEKKPSEDQIKSMIRLTPSYKEKEQLYFEAKKNEGILGIAKEAFVQRSSMLISISANLRGESDTDLAINKKAVADKIKAVRDGHK
jgi:hypothetical protein